MRNGKTNKCLLLYLCRARKSGWDRRKHEISRVYELTPELRALSHATRDVPVGKQYLRCVSLVSRAFDRLGTIFRLGSFAMARSVVVLR